MMNNVIENDFIHDMNGMNDMKDDVHVHVHNNNNNENDDNKTSSDPNFVSKLFPLGSSFLEYVALYLFWMSSHYLLSRIYVFYCTPAGSWGFITSFFSVGAPHCNIIRNMFTFTGDVVQNMWVVFGIWSCKHVLNLVRKNI